MICVKNIIVVTAAAKISLIGSAKNTANTLFSMKIGRIKIKGIITWFSLHSAQTRFEGKRNEDEYNELIIEEKSFIRGSAFSELGKYQLIINSEMKEVIMDYQLQAAEIFKVESIRLESIHKMNGHPTIRGMSQITEQIFSYLEDRVYL